MSYYTGPIFEIEFPGFSGSGGGGGRYDDLVGMFTGQASLPVALAWAWSASCCSWRNATCSPHGWPASRRCWSRSLTRPRPAPRFRLATALRGAGLRVDLYPDQDRYGKQFKYAEERQIRYAALVSPREVEAGVVAVKDLVSGEQVDVPGPTVADWLAERVDDYERVKAVHPLSYYFDRAVQSVPRNSHIARERPRPAASTRSRCISRRCPSGKA